MVGMSEEAGAPVRIAIVDDHPLFRAGVHTILASQSELKVVAQAGGYDEALRVVGSTSIDLVILDIQLPGTDGVAVARALRSQNPSAKILGLSVIDEPVRIADLLRSGATSFVHKSQPIDELLAAIRLTVAGERYLYPAMREQVEPLLHRDRKLPLEQLTAREREVFELLVKGHSNERAARELGIAPRTVETHRQHVMKKLDVHSIAELVRMGARWGALH
jgi:DNA-binding NarL/FixJ family response regulator